MATVELITNTVVGSGGASSVTFSSIPQTYQHLMIVASGRSARSVYQDGSNMLFNGETSGNNQSAVTMVNNGNAPLGTSETNDNRVSYLFDCPAASALADQFGTNLAYFPNYRWGEFKNAIGWNANPGYSGDTNDYSNDFCVGSWRSTSAVTSILIQNGVGNFLEHSTFTLYGINAA
tara:strand:- start:28 stop:558 length:531 start_codon:yes stop_codon:yes gene_type:complete